MKFIIRHEMKGRMRIHFSSGKMTCREADTLQYYLENLEGVIGVKVYEYTSDAVIHYRCERKLVILGLKRFHFQEIQVPASVLDHSGRELNVKYREKLIARVMMRLGSKLLLPLPLRNGITVLRSVKYLKEGLSCLLHRKLEVPVLDATAIGASILRGNLDTAGSVMFLLGIGELLEEWTHKKSVGDLARSMSLNIPRVWIKSGAQEVLVDTDKVKEGDLVIARMGNIIPFDGMVAEGEGMVNQASLTGEALPVRRTIGGMVYAGTVLEEGELAIRVQKASGYSRYEKIVTMIEDSEKLKSAVESRAEHLADQLVPYTLAGTGLVWLLTRNVTKAMAVLMVDFSCALKLAMPVTVLSAIREAGTHHITVKGGKYLEAVAEAKTIVFDKTGTLTEARPTVKKIVPFCDMPREELLRIAACLEEHFPHSMAKAVVKEASRQGLDHEEMHSKVEYIVAHGISSHIDGKKVVIGSAHFVFEDEQCRIPEEYQGDFDALPAEYSHLYMAIDHVLAAVICIEDPLRPEAGEVVRQLKKAGFEKVVMMTGDSERTACAVAKRVGVDEYYSEVLPEDKAGFITKERQEGRKVLMVGDGINDSPALSAADVGIAISDGAEIAREIADITISADSLREIIVLKLLSDALMKKIHKNYRNIVGFNTGLIVLGVLSVLQPTTSAMLHNLSTVYIGVRSMDNLLQ